MQYLSMGVTREDVEEPPGSAPAALIAPELHALLYYASLAPSGHNAQPWTVRIDGREIWVGTDSARWLPKVDPANRELMLSVGAFLENLIAAAPAHGFVADCEVVGTRPTTDVARVVLKSMAPRDARSSACANAARFAVVSRIATSPLRTCRRFVRLAAMTTFISSRRGRNTAGVWPKRRLKRTA